MVGSKTTKNRERIVHKKMSWIIPLVLVTVAVLCVLFFQNDETTESPETPRQQSLLRDSNSAPVSNPMREQALRDAAYEGRIQAVQQELTQGANPNTSDENGRTALMLAAFNGYDTVVKALLTHNAKVNTCDNTGRTALMYAASGPNEQTVRMLLEKKADPNIKDKGEGWTALMFAAAEGQTQVVKDLLQHGADKTAKDIDGETACDFARNNSHGDVVRLLEQ